MRGYLQLKKVLIICIIGALVEQNQTLKARHVEFMH